MLTKKDKEEIITAFNSIDVKRFTIDNQDPRSVKWFRFGSYNAMQIAAEIIKQLPEKQTRKKTERVV